jgi:hypothetical protein
MAGKIRRRGEGEFSKAAKKWLKENAGTYRIKRVIPGDAEKK